MYNEKTVQNSIIENILTEANNSLSKDTSHHLSFDKLRRDDVINNGKLLLWPQ